MSQVILRELKLNSAVKYIARAGFVNNFPITFAYDNPTQLQVFVGFKRVPSWELKMENGLPSVVLPEDLEIGKSITIRRATPADGVPHTYQYKGNAQGGAEFNAMTIDENFEYMAELVAEVEDYNTIAQDNLNDIEEKFDDTVAYMDEELAKGREIAKEALDTANRADKKADSAVGTADAAKGIAEDAKEASGGAVSTSNEALRIASEAKETSNTANEISGNALIAASQAETNSEQAKELSETALNNSSEALDIAVGAKDTAEGIASIAQEALDTSQGASNTAEGALSTASDAKAIAEGIEGKADQAISIAEGAKVVAEGAEDIAREALDKAQEGGITEPELINKSVGSGKWMREGVSKRDFLSTESEYITPSNVSEFKVGDSVFTSKDVIVANHPELGAIQGYWFNLNVQKLSFVGDEEIYISNARGISLYRATRRSSDGSWGNLTSILTDKNTTTDKSNVLHSGTRTPIDTLNVSDMAQDVVNRDDLTVTSGAVYRGLTKKRDKTDNVFDGHVSIKSDGTVRGRMSYGGDGLQIEQVQEDGTQQNFTFPKDGEGGEISLTSYVDDKFGKTAEPTVESDTPTLNYHGVQLGNRLGNNSVELNTTTTNGSRAKPTKLVAGTGYITETFFDFWDISSRYGLINSVPVINDSGRYALPIASIDTVSPNTPFIPNKFRMGKASYAAYSSFFHTSNNTLHGVLKGNITILLRTSTSLVPNDAYNTIPPTMFLVLSSENKPDYQLASRFGLSLNSNLIKKEPVFLNPRNSGNFYQTDLLNIDYEVALDIVKDNPTVNDQSSVSGYIAPNDTTGDLVGTGFPNHRTTNWIKCNPMASHYLLKGSQEDGDSDNTRIQWKDSLGFIHYDVQNAVRGCNRIVNIHPNAVEFRVWYANKDADAELFVWSLPVEINPYYGTWYEYTFNVNTIVDFDPNQLYSFSVETYNGLNVQTPKTDRDVIVVNGGLSLITESRDMIQDELNKRGIL